MGKVRRTKRDKPAVGPYEINIMNTEKEIKRTKQEIKNQLETGQNSIVTRSKCVYSSSGSCCYFNLIRLAIIALKEIGGSSIEKISMFVSANNGVMATNPDTFNLIRETIHTAVQSGKLIQNNNLFELAPPRSLKPNMTVITSITNCGNFMHIVVLTYSWIQLQNRDIKFDAIQPKLDEVRLMTITSFFKLSTDYLIKPQPLNTPTMQLRCYGITKPTSIGNGLVTIAHYFAVLTDGETGILYNAYGSDLTKNPGYSMDINIGAFSNFIRICNNEELASDDRKRYLYHKYFLANSVDFWDDEEQITVAARERDEYEEFVSGEPNLRIYEIDGYQKKVQEALKALINAPEPPRGGQKRKSKRKKRSRRTRRRKRTKTRRRRKK